MRIYDNKNQKIKHTDQEYQSYSDELSEYIISMLACNASSLGGYLTMNLVVRHGNTDFFICNDNTRHISYTNRNRNRNHKDAQNDGYPFNNGTNRF